MKQIEQVKCDSLGIRRFVMDHLTVDPRYLSTDILIREDFKQGTESPIKRLEKTCEVFQGQLPSQTPINLYGIYYELGVNILIHSYGIDRKTFDMDHLENAVVFFFYAMGDSARYEHRTIIEGVLVDFGRPADKNDIVAQHSQKQQPGEERLLGSQGLNFVEYFTTEFQLPTYIEPLVGNLTHFLIDPAEQAED